MKKTDERPYSPPAVMAEWKRGVEVKRAMGPHGMVEQNRINERFFCGDQWHGISCGSNRPLVRHNIIKRIGDYKMAIVASAPMTVQFSAEGMPHTLELEERVACIRAQMQRGESVCYLSAEEEAQTVAGALTDYFVTTSRRLGLDALGRQALRDAYVTGTGVLYTYWDDRVRTGLYADRSHTTPIRGDIACEVLGVEQVYVGDPLLGELQQQPYILIEQRLPAVQVQRLAERYNGDCCTIQPDEGGKDMRKHTTVITRLWKEWSADGELCTVKAVQVCRDGTVRPVWDMGVRLYPLAFFRWEEKRCRAYGESEIPYLIPNQIAINRTVSAGVWSVMMMGMPIMMVNGDVVQQPITNDPGQIITVYGAAEEMANAIHYVDPPAFAGQLDANVQNLISDTLTQAGISSTLLGDVKPDNTSAILAVREASLMPLQMVQNRYFRFVEEVARIWCEFWLTMYGNRSLKIQQPDGVWYMPFDADKYREMLLNITVDIGAGSPYSEERTVETLDNLYKNGVITVKQYLSRLPQGYVPKLDALLRELE